jgi:hypothetical protein
MHFARASSGAYGGNFRCCLEAKITMIDAADLMRISIEDGKCFEALVYSSDSLLPPGS